MWRDLLLLLSMAWKIRAVRRKRELSRFSAISSTCCKTVSRPHRRNDPLHLSPFSFLHNIRHIQRRPNTPLAREYMVSNRPYCNTNFPDTIGEVDLLFLTTLTALQIFGKKGDEHEDLFSACFTFLLRFFLFPLPNFLCFSMLLPFPTSSLYHAVRFDTFCSN